jgi:hypothetical protein
LYRKLKKDFTDLAVSMEWSDPRRVKEKNAQPGQELLVYR